MADNNIKSMIGKVFNDIADAMQTGQFGERVRVGITVAGSELGIDNIVKGAEMAQARDNSIEVVLIGPKVDSNLLNTMLKVKMLSIRKWKNYLIVEK